MGRDHGDYPGYAAYQRKTTRRIPVLILTPKE
jgi:hypothetical protein